MAIDRKDWQSIEKKGYQKNRIAINRTEWLSTDEYQQSRMVIDRTEQLLIEHNGYLQNRMAIDKTEWLSVKQSGY